MSTQAATATGRTIPAHFPGTPRRRAEAGRREVRRAHATAEMQRADRTLEQAREQEALILKLMGLVKRVAFELREHLPAHVELDDLVSAGTLGLIDAVRRFEADKEVKIETYARYRIRGAMLDSLRRSDPVSREMRKKNKQAEEVFQGLAMKLGRAPNDAEMADALRVSLDKWYGTVNSLQGTGVEWLRPTQMNDSYPTDEENLPDNTGPDQFDLCYRREQRDLLNRALQQASERDRRILSLYYEQDFTMKEIADELGVDESRVSQIHSSLLARLRKNVSSMLRPATLKPGLAEAA